MNGLAGLLEGLGVLVVAYGGLIWRDRRMRPERRRERHPGLPPRQPADDVPAELLRPEDRESEIRDRLYGEASKPVAESGVLSTRRVPAGTRRENRPD